MDKQIMIYSYTRIAHSNKKNEWITDIHNNIHGYQNHYGWKMPCTKRYIKYNSTHMKFEESRSNL